jgi:hypothetical protein
MFSFYSNEFVEKLVFDNPNFRLGPWPTSFYDPKDEIVLVMRSKRLFDAFIASSYPDSYAIWKLSP